MTTINKATMLSKIYEAIARKDLSFGCRIHNGRNGIIIGKDYDENGETGRYRIIDDGENVYTTINPLTIIGHPVLLSDVLNLIYKNKQTFTDEQNLLELWNMSIPTIDDQSIDVIQYIYNLLPNQ